MASLIPAAGTPLDTPMTSQPKFAILDHRAAGVRVVPQRDNIRGNAPMAAGSLTMPLPLGEEPIIPEDETDVAAHGRYTVKVVTI